MTTNDAPKPSGLPYYVDVQGPFVPGVHTLGANGAYGPAHIAAEGPGVANLPYFSTVGAHVQPVMPSSPLHTFRRMPTPDSAERRAPRSFVPEQFMAIEPNALERSFFPGFFDDEDVKPYDMFGAVAIVTIEGPLMQRGGWWWDGYEQIRDRFEAALKDEAVGAVVLKINSPGGMCAGCFSAARDMRQMKSDAGKPVFAFADESAFSAAYAMACIADEIYLPREGGVGSIGVIGVLEDWTDFNEQMGIKVAVITSGKYKADGHPDVALKKDVIDRYQARIDSLAGSFAELVGGARGMTPVDVLKLEANVFYGSDAVGAGLANGVASLDDVLNLAAGEAARRFTTRFTRTPASQGAQHATRIIRHL